MKQFLLVITLMMLGAGVAQAAETKIGYIDMQRTLNLSEAGVQAKNQLQDKVQGYQKQINAKQEELQKLKNDLEKQSVALNEATRAAREKDYQQKLKDFQRFAKDAEEDMQARDGELTRKILETLEKLISDYGSKNGFTVILDAHSAGLLYADKSIDVTDAVLKELNAATKGKK
ncbi:MAG: OmpH family outer membrane protein [Trichlorobacter sp.]|nr:OmpH family outer membrane protein [Trichlorobacter sp.]